MDKKNFYRNFSNDYYEKNLNKFRISHKDYTCKNESSLLYLIKQIPLWESYLTEKQIKITKLFINIGNTKEIDRQLNLKEGNAWYTLFGNGNKFGVYNKLKNIYEKFLINENL